MSEWRVGRKLGRTLYEGETLVGMMDSVELAARVVAAMNRGGEGIVSQAPSAEPLTPSPTRPAEPPKRGDE